MVEINMRKETYKELKENRNQLRVWILALLILMGFMILFMAQSVSASTWGATVTETNNINRGGLETSTTKDGLKIYAKSTGMIYDVYKFSGVNATTAYILDAGKTVLATSTFSGAKANFNYNIQVGTTYFVVVDSGGSAYTRNYGDGTIVNIAGTFINWTGGVRGSINGSADSDNIQYIIAGNSSVNLTSPNNGQAMTSNSVTTNATATVVGGATLTNMTYYDNSTGTWGARNTTKFANISNLTQTTVGSGMDVLVKTLNTSDSYINYIYDEFRVSGVDGTTIDYIYYYTDGTTATQSNSTSSTGFVSVYYYNPYLYKSVSRIEIYLDDAGAGSAYERNATAVSGGNNATMNFYNTYPSGSNILWNVQACDSDGDCGFSASNYTFTVDSTAPTVVVNYPTSIVNYGRNGGTLQLNYTATDSNLDKCWYSYDGVNSSATSCTTAVANLANITLTSTKTLIAYANDTAGNIGSATKSWDYKVFENINSYNTSTAETAYETFRINVTANSSLSRIWLNWNGTSYQLTQESLTNWSKSFDIPSGNTGNKSMNYIYQYAGSNITGDTFYQQVNSTIFVLCNATYANDFLNLTFKDEATLSNINASIPSSSFEYYIGSGSVTKTYTYSTTSNNYNYSFCASPTDRTFYVIPSVQYKQGTDYPQRSWDDSIITLTASVTTKVLYLLSYLDGTPVTFQVVNSAEQNVEGALVNISRSGYGVIELKNTDASGTATFFLDPNYEYSVAVSKTGYTTTTVSITPTQSTYTITLGGGLISTNISDYYKGVSISLLPALSSLNNGTNYDFNFTLSSSFWDIDEFGFVLKNSSGYVLGSDSISSANSGTASVNLETPESDKVIMYYYWVVSGVYTNGSQTWNIFDNSATSHSLSNFATRLKYYIVGAVGVDEDGIFGLDTFGLNIIVFLIIFVSGGVMAYKFGLDRPALILGTMTILTFVFDVFMEFITYPEFIPSVLNPGAASLLMILFTASAIFYEVTQ